MLRGIRRERMFYRPPGLSPDGDRGESQHDVELRVRAFVTELQVGLQIDGWMDRWIDRYHALYHSHATRFCDAGPIHPSIHLSIYSFI